MSENHHNQCGAEVRQPALSNISSDSSNLLLRFRSLCVGNRYCVVVMLGFVIAIGLVPVSAQESMRNSAESSQAFSGAASKKEQLIRSLQNLRNSKSDGSDLSPPSVVAPSDLKNQMTESGIANREEELFLDLSNARTSAALPDESDSVPARASTLDVSMASSPTQILLRAAAWIAIVLCVCCLAILAARRWQRERGLLPTMTSHSKVIETLSLGPGRTVSLIEMYGYRAMVATDSGGIRSLVLAPTSFEESLLHEADNEQ